MVMDIMSIALYAIAILLIPNNIDDAYIDEVLTALKGEGNVMFRIENADRTVESYLIEVATSNFAELYNAQTGQ